MSLTSAPTTASHSFWNNHTPLHQRARYSFSSVRNILYSDQLTLTHSLDLMEAFSDLPTYTSHLDFIAKGGQHSLKTQDKCTNSKISFWGKFIKFLYTQNLDRIMGGKRKIAT